MTLMPRKRIFLQARVFSRGLEFVLSASVVLACNARPDMHASGDPAMDSTGGVDTQAEVTVNSEVSTVGGTTSTSDELSSTSSTSTGGGPQPCETWNDACPDGMKCMPYATVGFTGLGNLDAQGCFPIPTDPGSIGMTCKPLEALNAEVIQLDTCGKGALCWDGVCVSLCQGEIDSWECPSGLNCAPLLPLAICLPSCDPLSPDCDVGEVCEPASDFFRCSPATSEKGLFEICEVNTDCAQGLVCSPSSWVGECAQNAPGCCNSLCDLQVSNCPGAGQECVQFYTPPQSGYEDLGVCMVPT